MGDYSRIGTPPDICIEMSQSDPNRLDMIVPSTPEDLRTFLKWYQWIYKCLPIKRIIIIGNAETGNLLKNHPKIMFLNQDELLPKDTLKRIISEISDNNVFAVNRTGWYLQQFLKFEYSTLCKDEYYLVWDADTIPTHKLPLFSPAGKPFFALKNEYHRPYFLTMERLVPGLKKNIAGSFIAEHMVMKAEIVRELMQRIEQNASESNEPFYKCILKSIDEKDLPESGFSEFETYGNYCKSFYPDTYEDRPWYSLRPANYYFRKISKKDLQWIGRDYDAMSFEYKWNATGIKRIAIRLIQLAFSLNLTHHLSCRKIVESMETINGCLKHIITN